MAGIYIHIPFCKKKCSYCDFHFSTTFETYRGRMIDALIAEIDSRKHEIQEVVETIYFGGGTPSLLTVEEIGRILTKINESFSIVKEPEVTLETNPDDFGSRAIVEGWKAVGVNRLSIGIQSFRQKDLDWMNRAHSAEEAELAIDLAREVGFNNLTIDLIYGLPETTIDEWGAQLDRFLDLNIDHLSAYCLTIEERTALSNWVKKGKITPSFEEDQGAQFELLVAKLAANGFEHYEISNFAKPGRRSRHNTAYWSRANYLGIGPSAHSFNGLTRRWNIANNGAYMNAISNNSIFWEEEFLDEKDRFNELILTGLRRMEGVSLNELQEILPLSDEFNTHLLAFVEMGWVNKTDDRILLSFEGKLRADHIAAELFVV